VTMLPYKVKCGEAILDGVMFLEFGSGRPAGRQWGTKACRGTVIHLHDGL
jgi:hypothetical protein